MGPQGGRGGSRAGRERHRCGDCWPAGPGCGLPGGTGGDQEGPGVARRDREGRQSSGSTGTSMTIAFHSFSTHPRVFKKVLREQKVVCLAWPQESALEEGRAGCWGESWWPRASGHCATSGCWGLTGPRSGCPHVPVTTLPEQTWPVTRRRRFCHPGPARSSAGPCASGSVRREAHREGVDVAFSAGRA